MTAGVPVLLVLGKLGALAGLTALPYTTGLSGYLAAALLTVCASGLPPPPWVASCVVEQEVTSRKDQGQYWAREASSYRFMPITQMHHAFMASPQGQAQLAALQAPAPQVPPYLDPLVREKYALGRWGNFKALLRRDATLMRRNSFLYT